MEHGLLGTVVFHSVTCLNVVAVSLKDELKELSNRKTKYNVPLLLFSFRQLNKSNNFHSKGVLQV